MTNKDPNLIKTPIADDKVAVTNATVSNKDIANTKTTQQDNGRVEDETLVHQGTETLKNDVYDSEHVKEGDNPARQPDRRDQQGQTPFDKGINEDTTHLNEQPKSEEISDRDRYATLDNAQTRVLAEEDSKPAQ